MRSGRAAACALVLALAVTGCTGSARTPTPSASPTGPAPRSSSPADVCTGLVSYWIRAALTGSKWAGLDWEQKGLSNGQYELHEEVLAEARAVQRTRGLEAALELTDRRVRQRCEETGGATESSENWRPPR